MRIKSVFILVLVAMVMGACANSNQKRTSEKAEATPKPEATSPVVAELKKADTEKNEMTCRRGEEVRTLVIESVEPKGCRLYYSRLGVKSNMASSIHGNGHCEKVRDNIGANLKNAEFTCLTVESKNP